MKIQVNGDMMELQDGSTIAGLIEQMELGERRIAVEHNLEIVPRSQHEETMLKDGDRVEIVHAIGGG
ncbi:MAG: sulfur carrier protein ThiS [Amphritea sp.]|nr:sulfur carrier protein ThiS [Amphritea sp.]